MARISDVLREKGSDVVSIGPETTIHDAIAELVDRRIGCLLVREGDGAPGEGWKRAAEAAPFVAWSRA